MTTSLKGIEGEVMKKIDKVELYHNCTHHAKYLVVDFIHNYLQVKKSRSEKSTKKIMLSDIRTCALMDDNLTDQS